MLINLIYTVGNTMKKFITITFLLSLCTMGYAQTVDSNDNDSQTQEQNHTHQLLKAAGAASMVTQANHCYGQYHSLNQGVAGKKWYQRMSSHPGSKAMKLTEMDACGSSDAVTNAVQKYNKKHGQFKANHPKFANLEKKRQAEHEGPLAKNFAEAHPHFKNNHKVTAELVKHHKKRRHRKLRRHGI